MTDEVEDGTPIPRALRRRRNDPPSAVERSLKALGARMPSTDEAAAIRALARGNADSVQQMRAITYMLSELCGVGRITFSGEATHTSAFRNGATAVALAFAQIGGAVLMRFPRAE